MDYGLYVDDSFVSDTDRTVTVFFQTRLQFSLLTVGLGAGISHCDEHCKFITSAVRLTQGFQIP